MKCVLTALSVFVLATLAYAGVEVTTNPEFEWPLPTYLEGAY